MLVRPTFSRPVLIDLTAEPLFAVPGELVLPDELEAPPGLGPELLDRSGTVRCEPYDWGLAAQALRFTLADSALQSLGRARRALHNQSSALHAIAQNEIGRAQRMLTELRALAEVHDLDDDPEAGTVDVLCALYDFCNERLVAAFDSGDDAMLDAVADVLVELRTAFSPNL